MDTVNSGFDLHRIFIGDQSPLFLFEIVFRTLFLYLYTLLLLRLLGKRDIQQLTFFEFAIIIALGSAVGDPMFYPDVPLLHGAIVILTIVLVQRAITVLTEHNETLASVIESVPTRLVKNGVLQLSALDDERMSRDEVFSRLRVEGLRHLGEVERAYLEPTGSVSVWTLKKAQARPGLTLMPKEDPDFPAQYECGHVALVAEVYACLRCGSTSELHATDVLGTCICDGTQWQIAANA